VRTLIAPSRDAKGKVYKTAAELPFASLLK